MKRAKILLTAITVLAVVGGALAFKAKTFSGNIYCTGTDFPGTCPNVLRDIAFKSGSTTIAYVKVNQASDCSNSKDCTASGTTTTQE